METGGQQLTIFTLISGILVSVVVSLLYWLKSSPKSTTPQPTPAPKPQPKKQQNGSVVPKTQSAKQRPVRKAAATSHPLFVNMLRGHVDDILDMDLGQCGKLLATVSLDGTARLWHIKDMDKGKDIKYTRIPLDNAGTSISISPDSKAVAVLCPVISSVLIYKLGKKAGDDSSCVLTISNIEGDLKDVAISPTGKFIMVSTIKTAVHIYTLKGDLLHTIDTAQMTNGQVSISPCQDFVAAAGFTPEVHLWAVRHSNAGAFKEVVEAMDLSGHKSGVYSFSFSGDCTRAVTVSKDGTWRVHNTNVSWTLNEDPKLLTSGTVAESGTAVVAMSGDGRVVAIATNTSVNFYNSDTAEHLDTLHEVHSDTIQKMSFSDTGKFLYTAGRDKTVRVWLNRAGMIRDVELWQESLKTASNPSHKDRLRQQIEENRAKLKDLEK